LGTHAENANKIACKKPIAGRSSFAVRNNSLGAITPGKENDMLFTKVFHDNLNEKQKPERMGAGYAAAAAMRRIRQLLLLGCLMPALPAIAGIPAGPGNTYNVLPAIRRGNLTIFPVVSSQEHDTSGLITLDEGIRSGQVTVTEVGDERGLVRPGQIVPPRGQAEVNRLELSNSSGRPLLLLAGEIVTGGKQDRIIGADRIVPPNLGPIDLSVFCVEPGRWVGSNQNFGSMNAQMAQPSVRAPALAQKDQSKVWDNVGIATRQMVQELGAASAVTTQTTSYAKVFESEPVQKKIAEIGGPDLEQTLLRELRKEGAVGAVMAANGTVMWADIFASTDLLVRYWPKLFKSYQAEAITSRAGGGFADLQEARKYVNNLAGGREVVETEPGVYSRTEVTGDGFRVFELTSLFPKTGFDVHITKLRE
jgi:hypothetical protein